MGASKAIQIMAAREREGRWEGGRGRERQTDKQSLQLLSPFSLYPTPPPAYEGSLANTLPCLLPLSVSDYLPTANRTPGTESLGGGDLLYGSDLLYASHSKFVRTQTSWALPLRFSVRCPGLR